MLRIIFFIFCSLFFAFNVYAEDDIVRFIEKQHIELTRKEDAIKKEDARLKALKKELGEDIEKYTRILQQIDEALKKAEETKDKRLKHVAKAYEAMPPEDAALRLSGLDEATAVKIILKMNSKKAGIVIGMMKTDKATRITKKIARLEK